MKKNLIVTLLSFSILACTYAQQPNNPNISTKQETKYWKRFANRFFPKGRSEFYRPGKFYDDIQIQIINGKQTDSLAMLDLIKELNPLIPNKISYALTKESANFFIEPLNDHPFKTNYRPEGLKTVFGDTITRYQDHRTEVTNKNDYYDNAIKKQYYAPIIADSISQTNRAKVLRYYTVRGLTEVSGRYFSRLIQSGAEEPSVFNPYYTRYGENNTNMKEYADFTLQDKFYLSKLYAPDLDEQLKKFLTQEYNWWIYLNFLLDEKLIIGLKILIFIFYFLLLITLSYKTILTKKFKHSFLGYFANAIFISTAIAFALFLNNNLKSPQIFYEINESQFNSHIAAFFKYTWGLGLFAIALITPLFFLEKYLIKTKYDLLYRILLKTSLTLVALNLPLLVLLYFKPENQLNFPIFTIALPCFFVIALARGIFLFIKESAEHKLHKKDVELSQLKELKAQAEVAALHARITPHFLYNSLNSIASLAHSDPDKTEQMAISLSDLFRHNINRKNTSTTSIIDEVEAVKAYLGIEQIRFGERMRFSIDLDTATKDLKIPRNIIQPLIENAIKHGVSQIPGQGTIVLTIKKTAEGIGISVQDNGPEFPEGIVSGYGLQSIHDILNLSYKNQATLNWENSPKKRIWIEITKKGLEKNIENE